MIENSDWITPAQAAVLADYKEEYVRALARSGKLKAEKFGHAVLISKQSLLEYLEKQGRKPEEV